MNENFSFNNLEKEFANLNKDIEESEELRAKENGFASTSELHLQENLDKEENKKPYSSPIKKFEWRKENSLDHKHGEYNYKCYLYVDKPVSQLGKTIIVKHMVDISSELRKEFDLAKFTSEFRNKIEEVLQNMVNVEMPFEFKVKSYEQYGIDLDDVKESVFTEPSLGWILKYFRKAFDKKENNTEATNQTSNNTEVKENNRDIQPGLFDEE